MRIAQREGIVMTRDPASKTLRGTSANGSSAIWVTDAALLEELIAGAERLGVRRFAFWRLGQEDPAVWSAGCLSPQLRPSTAQSAADLLSSCGCLFAIPRSMATRTLKGILLDIDGTLLDSNDAHAAAFTKAFAEHGIEIPFEHVRPLVGMGGDKLIPSLTGFAEDTPKGEAIVERKKGIFEERYLPRLEPTRGARALLERFLADGLTLVVATSAGGTR